MCIKGKIWDPDLATIVRKPEKSEDSRRKAEADPTGCKDTTFTDSPLLRLKAKNSSSVSLAIIKKAAPHSHGVLLFIEEALFKSLSVFP